MASQHSFPQPTSPGIPPVTSTSGAAITGMIFGILSLIVIPGFLPFSITAVILSHIALGKIKASPFVSGKGLAVTGLATGYVSMAIGLSAIAFFVYVARLDTDSAPTTEAKSVTPEEAECFVILPEGHNPETPIPGAIWLHGYGWNPSEIEIFEDIYQDWANQLRIAFLGISATQKLEEGSYQWTEDLLDDGTYLSEVIEANRDKVNLRWPEVALFGFSQGAKVAGDLAINDPSKFAGAILCSPGGFKSRPEAPESPQPGNEKQHFFCFVGADEAYGNVRLNRQYHDLFVEQGSTSVHKEYPGMEDHSTPPDFDEKLGDWLSVVLALEKPADP